MRDANPRGPLEGFASREYATQRAAGRTPSLAVRGERLGETLIEKAVDV